MSFNLGRTTAENSLFTYISPDNWDLKNDPTFTPLFWVADLEIMFPNTAKRLQAVRLCYNSDATVAIDPSPESRRPCYYDYAVTDSEVIAAATGGKANEIALEKTIVGENIMCILRMFLRK